MPRKRQPWNPLLKSYPESEKINVVSFGAETLFTRLLAKSDDCANFWGSSRLILSYIFGHRAANGSISRRSVKKFVRELARVGLITIYVGDDKKVYIHVVDCKKALRSDVAEDVRCPEFTANSPIVQPADYEAGSATKTGRTRNDDGPNPARTRNDIGTPTRPDQTRLDQTKERERPRNESKPETRLAEDAHPLRLDQAAEALRAMNSPAFNGIEQPTLLSALSQEKIPGDRWTEILCEVRDALNNRKPPPPGKRDNPTGYALKIIKKKGKAIREALAEDEAAKRDANVNRFDGTLFNEQERAELIEKYHKRFPGITVVFDDTQPFEPDVPRPGPGPGPGADLGTTPAEPDKTEKENTNAT